MIRLFSLAVGYVFGCFQTSWFYGKTQNIDIRQHGSGNAGTTNALRVMGPKAGVVTFIGDLLKMLLAYVLTWFLFKGKGADYAMTVKLYTGIGVVLGHDFPFYLEFKGGKGIAVTGGLMLLLDWRMALLCAVLFFGISYLTHLVSLASCTMVVCEFALFLLLVKKDLIPLGLMSDTEALIIMGLWALLALWRHKANIGRLIHGRESRVYIKKDRNKTSDTRKTRR